MGFMVDFFHFKLSEAPTDYFSCKLFNKWAFFKTYNTKLY